MNTDVTSSICITTDTTGELTIDVTTIVVTTATETLSIGPTTQLEH